MLINGFIKKKLTQYLPTQFNKRIFHKCSNFCNGITSLHFFFDFQKWTVKAPSSDVSCNIFLLFNCSWSCIHIQKLLPFKIPGWLIYYIAFSWLLTQNLHVLTASCIWSRFATGNSVNSWQLKGFHLNLHRHIIQPCFYYHWVITCQIASVVIWTGTALWDYLFKI